MTVTTETIAVLAFLIPGFIGAGVLNAVRPRKTSDMLSRTVEALTLSFIVYAAVALFLGGIPPLIESREVDGVRQYSVHYEPRIWLPALGFALLIPLVIGLLARFDLYFRILRWLRLTDQVGYSDTWIGLFTQEQRYLTVNMTDGRRVFGWPMYVSNTQEEGLIFLFNPYWIEPTGDYREMGVHGILLSKERISSIEFTTVSRNNARLLPPKEAPNG